MRFDEHIQVIRVEYKFLNLKNSDGWNFIISDAEMKKFYTIETNSTPKERNIEKSKIEECLGYIFKKAQKGYFKKASSTNFLANDMISEAKVIGYENYMAVVKIKFNVDVCYDLNIMIHPEDIPILKRLPKYTDINMPEYKAGEKNKEFLKSTLNYREKFKSGTVTQAGSIKVKYREFININSISSFVFEFDLNTKNEKEQNNLKFLQKMFISNPTDRTYYLNFNNAKNIRAINNEHDSYEIAFEYGENISISFDVQKEDYLAFYFRFNKKGKRD